MGRRTELANVADGMSGHWVRWAPWEPDQVIMDLAYEAIRSETQTVRLDFKGTEVLHEGGTRHLLLADLERHLQRRGIPIEWVRSATIKVWTKPAIGPTAEIPVSGRISIIDDRGRIHASTRNVLLEPPPVGLVARLRRRFLSGR